MKNNKYFIYENAIKALIRQCSQGKITIEECDDAINKLLK